MPAKKATTCHHPRGREACARPHLRPLPEACPPLLACPPTRVCLRQARCWGGASLVLPLDRKHLASHSRARQRREDLLLLAMTDVGVKLNQILLARHGHLKIVERNSYAGKKAVHLRNQVDRAIRGNAKQ